METLENYNGEDQIPLDLIVPELTYIVAELEQFQEIAELFGRDVDCEVEWFLSDAHGCL